MFILSEKIPQKEPTKTSKAMSKFFRFPHTPHLTWIGNHPPRNDKILSPNERKIFLSREVVIEEKIDGANIGFSLAKEGTIQVQNRGNYLFPPYTGQFSRLENWINLHGQELKKMLDENIIIFGEWCAARHSLSYSNLPDWLIFFDVYDRKSEHFWSSTRRDEFIKKSKTFSAPIIAKGKFSENQLIEIMNCNLSQYRKGPMEGLVIRQDTTDWCESRAKLVRPDFTQAIEKHWSSRRIEWNSLSKPNAYINKA